MKTRVTFIRVLDAFWFQSSDHQFHKAERGKIYKILSWGDQARNAEELSNVDKLLVMGGKLPLEAIVIP
jgi:hypothetical protein